MEHLTEWMDSASCRTVGDWMFFNEDPDWTVTSKARAVCAACPVWQECRLLGMGEEFGVWGGLTSHERKALRGRVFGTATSTQSTVLMFRVTRKAFSKAKGDVEKAIDMIPILRDELAMWSFDERQPNPKTGAA